MSVDSLLRSPSHRGHSIFCCELRRHYSLHFWHYKRQKLCPSSFFCDLYPLHSMRTPTSLFSLHSMLRNPTSLFSRLLVPLKRHISAVSLPRLLLFVEHRHAATHPPQPLGFVRHMSFIRQPMAIIFSGFRKKTRASFAPQGRFSPLRNVLALVCAETCVIRHSTLPPLRAPSPRRAAEKSSLHSLRVLPFLPFGSQFVLAPAHVAQNIFPCSPPLGTMIFNHLSSCVLEHACLWAHRLRALCLRALFLWAHSLRARRL